MSSPSLSSKLNSEDEKKFNFRLSYNIVHLTSSASNSSALSCAEGQSAFGTITFRLTAHFFVPQWEKKICLENANVVNQGKPIFFSYLS